MHTAKTKAAVVLVLAVAGLALVAAAWLYAHRDEPVVWTIDVAPASTDIGTQVLNPFRDRGPEACAEHFLAQLRDGRIDEALSSMNEGVAPPEAQLDHERRHPIQSFVLRGRRDSGDQTLLYFRTIDVRGIDEGCFITVERGQGVWRVTRYERYD